MKKANTGTSTNIEVPPEIPIGFRSAYIRMCEATREVAREKSMEETEREKWTLQDKQNYLANFFKFEGEKRIVYGDDMCSASKVTGFSYEKIKEWIEINAPWCTGHQVHEEMTKYYSE